MHKSGHLGRLGELHSTDMSELLLKYTELFFLNRCYPGSSCPLVEFRFSWITALGDLVTLHWSLGLQVRDLSFDMGKGLMAGWKSGLSPFVMEMKASWRSTLGNKN